ncbi:nanos homolog 3 isoform X1 [Symphalangus syndactylus]|uniref:nanos homolog 3 isoform X1 n=1 Tax=Symphalangus syndactylus TaxID=9590 RepID=UPI003003AE00
MWCVCVSCMCLVPPGVPLCVAGFYDHPRAARHACTSCHPLPWVCVSQPPAHRSLCLWPACLCARVLPPAPLRSACVWVPACARPRPRVPDSPARAPGAASWRPTGIPRVRPGAPGGRPWGAHGRRWTHRPARRGEEGGGGGGERGHVTETDRRAGGRRRPRVRAGAGAPRPPPPPAHGPREPPPGPGAAEMQFPVQAPRARGAFPGGFWKEEGEMRWRPQSRFQRCREV